MDKITIICYTAARRNAWDEFVVKARNSSFLFMRDYMDYHADRFADHSLMAFAGNKLVGVLPANLEDDGSLHSHRGLTYGGWLLPPAHIDGADVLAFFHAMTDYCRCEGIKRVFYKPLPFIYARYPSQEDIYALFRAGGIVDSVNLSSAVDLQNPNSFNTLQRRLVKKAGESLPYARIEASSSEDEYDVAPFWNLLAECLAERHGAAPVHSCEELQLLRDRFPRNIKIFMVRDESGMPAAGVCVFESEMVAHCQYICSSPNGRRLHLLPLLFHFLIHEYYHPADNCQPGRNIRFFDFGTSNEDGGHVLNEGLLRQKFSFGATGVAYMRYRLDIE